MPETGNAWWLLSGLRGKGLNNPQARLSVAIFRKCECFNGMGVLRRPTADHGLRSTQMYA